MHLSSRPPLARIMAIDQAIRSSGWPNAGTLALELEVSPRTVRRDITYLRDRLHAPVEFDQVRHGYYYRDPSFRLPFFQLTEGELVAALLAERVLRQYRATPFEKDLRRAFIKMTEMLPDASPSGSTRWPIASRSCPPWKPLTIRRRSRRLPGRTLGGAGSRWCTGPPGGM